MEPTTHIIYASRPHSPAQDFTLEFSSEDEAREYAKSVVRGAPGEQGYVKVVLAAVIEQIN